MSEGEFYKKLYEFIEEKSSYRLGQAAFNLMTDLAPHIAKKYLGSDLDPFYNDERIEEFVRICLEELS